MASARSFVPIKTKSPLLGEVSVQVQLLHSQNVFWIFSRPLEIYRSVTLPVEQVFVNKLSLDASLGSGVGSGHIARLKHPRPSVAVLKFALGFCQPVPCEHCGRGSHVPNQGQSTTGIVASEPVATDGSPAWSILIPCTMHRVPFYLRVQAIPDAYSQVYRRI